MGDKQNNRIRWPSASAICFLACHWRITAAMFVQRQGEKNPRFSLEDSDGHLFFGGGGAAGRVKQIQSLHLQDLLQNF